MIQFDIPKAEKEPKDISKEFIEMDLLDFNQFVRTLKSEPVLSITIDWKDIFTARRLKAFLEETAPQGQERFAKIRATKNQMRQEQNVFSSGVEWEEIKE